jgi:hypothetical protein
MLRRLFCVGIAFLFVLTFIACSKKDAVEEPVTAGFECDVDVQYEDMNVKGHLARSTAGTLVMDIIEPETLDGLTMEWDGDTINMTMYGLSFNIDPDSIPQSALGQGILDALDVALQNESTGEVTESYVTTTGTSVNGEFEIVSDPATGYLLSLSIPSIDMNATFSNFAMTDTSETTTST